MERVTFASAYNQLQPSEREFVDAFLRSLDIEAQKRFERVTTTLERVVSTIDLQALDSRARDQFAKPIIQAAIRERVEDMARERDLTPDRIMREQAKIGFATIRAFFPRVGEDGHPIFDASNATEMDWAAVSHVKIEETYGRNGTTRKIDLKMHAKQAALDAMAKWTGLDKPDNAEASAYRSLPPELQKITANDTAETLADKYADFIAVQ